MALVAPRSPVHTSFYPTSPCPSSPSFASVYTFPSSSSPLRFTSQTPCPSSTTFVSIMNSPNRSLSPPTSPSRRAQIKTGASTPRNLKETLKRQCLAKMKKSRLDLVDKARGVDSPSKDQMELIIRDQLSSLRGRSMLATEDLTGDDYIEIMQFLEEAFVKDLQHEQIVGDAQLFEEAQNYDEEELQYLTQQLDSGGMEEEFSQEMLDALDEAEANYMGSMVTK